MVNDILDFSKLAAGRVVLEKLDFDLVELTETLVDSFAATARAKGIELALHADIHMPTGLRGDQSRLRQILNNLVANAIKFTERGEVTFGPPGRKTPPTTCWCGSRSSTRGLEFHCECRGACFNRLSRRKDRPAGASAAPGSAS